tara:strand:+ start:581 stop:1111 length:531 start_codon:yes stop_codon:yes gene_type:complete
MIKIEDNYLDQHAFDEIHNLLMSKEFPWYYNNNYGGNYPLTEYWFWHDTHGRKTLGNTNLLDPYFGVLQPLLSQLNPLALIRIRANCNWRTRDEEQRLWHRDTTVDCTTSILYINANDGCTVFKDCDTIVESVPNRFITFPSHMQHAAKPFTSPERRVLINFNYHARKEGSLKNVI